MMLRWVEAYGSLEKMITTTQTIKDLDFERVYLRDFLSNALGAEQKKSIALFGQMLAENGRISAAPKVRYI